MCVQSGRPSEGETRHYWVILDYAVGFKDHCHDNPIGLPFRGWLVQRQPVVHTKETYSQYEFWWFILLAFNLCCWIVYYLHMFWGRVDWVASVKMLQYLAIINKNMVAAVVMCVLMDTLGFWQLFNCWTLELDWPPVLTCHPLKGYFGILPLKLFI